MHPRSRKQRLTRFLGWAFLLAAVLGVAVWLLAPDFELDLPAGYSLRLEDGRFAVLLWPTPRDHPDSAGPDTRPLPLPLLAALALAAAAVSARSARRCSG